MASRGRLVLPDRPSILKKITKGFVREGIVQPFHDGSFVRASSLPTMCAREEVLASRLEIEREDKVTSDGCLAMAQGTGMHWVMQNEVLPTIGAYLVGQWLCKSCGKISGDSTDLEKRIPWFSECPQCGFISEDPHEGGPEYVEVELCSSEYRFTGHMDGFLRIPGIEGDGAFELKSISARGAEDVKECPNMGHVAQMQAYMWLTGLQWGLLLYWNKGVYRSPLIEHYVERDEDAVAEIKKMLVGIWRGLETGELPDRICTSSTCNRAEVCELVEQCFEVESKV